MSNLTQALTKRLLPDAAEFSPGLLAIQESPMPKLPRLIFYIVAVLFTILLAWAIFAKVDVVAVAEGKLVPVSYTKIVQPAEAGVVAEILVKEGDQVQAGQVLIRLDPTMTGADSRSLASELSLKRLTLRRVDAELAGTSLTLVPRGEQLLAEVQVKNEDVGFVQTNQHVRVKVAAYPFQKYGLLEGRIQTLAPDAQSNNGNPGQPAQQGYKALVKLDTQFLESLNGDTSQRKGLEAGMQVAAEIHQGRRTIMEYLLSPVQKVSAEAGRER